MRRFARLALDVRRRRAAQACALGLALVVGATACAGGDAETDLDRLLAVLRAADRESSTYTWTEVADQKIVVNGTNEDDFRYGGVVEVDDDVVLEQAVLDDAIMVKVGKPERLPASSGVGDDPVAVGLPGEGQIPEAALRAGSWVIDLDSAPGVGRRRTQKSRGGPIQGRDLVLEADSYLGRVEAFAKEAGFVVRFNEESAEYRPREDPFKKPDEDKDEIRYDFVRPPLPVPASSEEQQRQQGGAGGGAGQGAGRAGVPDAKVFRKLAVYVRKGRVVRILERVQLDERADATVRLMKTVLKEAKAPAAVQAEFANATLPGRETRSDAVLQAINFAGASADQNWVPVRFLTIEYTIRPDPAATVPLPAPLVAGDLEQFFGKVNPDGTVEDEETTPGGGRPGGTTPTTGLGATPTTTAS